MLSSTYRVLVDWDADGGLLLAGFESTTDNWTGATFGTAPPVLSQSTVRAYHGAGSLLATWGGGAVEVISTPVMGSFVVGRSYTFSAWVYVPSVGGRHVAAALAGIGFGTTSSVTDQWTQVSITFTATSTTHMLQLWTSGAPAAGEQTWIDYVQLLGAGEDVGPGGAERMPWESALDIRYGRDQGRALAPSGPGRLTGLELDNTSRDYSPLNSSSPLAGLLGPGREIAVTATHDGQLHSLYRGYSDDFGTSSDLAPGGRRATLTAMDGLTRLKGQAVSTAVYPALRTGEAVHRVLDAIGWTRGRDIDPGASTLRWWCADSDDAAGVLDQIVAAEGPAARLHVGPSGEIVFRDRHHRLVRSASLAVQATFRDVGVEPRHDPPVVVDVGWRDIVNVATCRVEEREPAMLHEEVWADTSIFTLSPGQLKTFELSFDNPVYGAIPPTWDDADPDIVTTTADAVTSALSRTSGRSLTLTLSTSPSAGAVVVTRVRLRALPVTTVRTIVVSAEDPVSIQANGRRTHPVTAPHVGRHDAAAICDLIIGQRATRLPVISFTLVNSSATALTEQLTRDLSDRVHVVDAESGFDDDAFVETIHHRISDGGKVHRTTFACEAAPAAPTDLFRFDTAGAGFDDGVFAAPGYVEPGSMFVFDAAGQGFDDGLFAT